MSRAKRRAKETEGKREEKSELKMRNFFASPSFASETQWADAQARHAVGDGRAGTSRAKRRAKERKERKRKWRKILVTFSPQQLVLPSFFLSFSSPRPLPRAPCLPLDSAHVSALQTIARTRSRRLESTNGLASPFFSFFTHAFFALHSLSPSLNFPSSPAPLCGQWPISPPCRAHFPSLHPILSRCGSFSASHCRLHLRSRPAPRPVATLQHTAA